ncbi:hypothetical protein DPX16_15051 [Anabarilius grahami]|uniref:Uncharacterized protein n=1 Tax=Anabarilius grahami TaxID=495550 RepID=A0A3N0YWY5_ANAGA|nr:hypothetical protein DPX16_15051 [Anabarilius grahami]
MGGEIPHRSWAHCESTSLASLRFRIAFFSGRDSAPRALPFSSSQEPVRKKQRGRGSQHLDESELTSAQVPCASLSPHREASHVHFSRPDQRPSAIASDLVSFAESDEEPLDDSMSLCPPAATGWKSKAAHTSKPCPPLLRAVLSQRQLSSSHPRTGRQPLSLRHDLSTDGARALLGATPLRCDWDPGPR